VIILNKFIPIKIQSGNKFSNQWCGGSRFAYKNYRDKWLKIIATFCGMGPFYLNCHASSGTKQVKIYGQYIRYMGKGERPFDDDNIKYGTKAIRDCLKPIISKRKGVVNLGLGWIYDDNPTWHEYECLQVKDDSCVLGRQKVGIQIVLATDKNDFTK
jgi:hypothetical protein